ncbi:arrestin [Viridothelium virens]|uniref:Arrestin n=1 Tax=Viridothelium virens TaxID=1048519 RepID=A0A6A6H1C2_VIRVR|nr:arrestin [Viridothelium virens]
MNVQIKLDKPNEVFTNLDVITGRVTLQLRNPVNVQSIVVKLEGESRTRLLAPPRDDRRERPRPELEIHKILYKTKQIYSPSGAEGQRPSGYAGILGTGQHEWPFSFKIPFNNACNANTNTNPNLSLSGLRLEVARQPSRHVKQTLPPNLTGFPGEADIRYFVKVTVARPQFFQQNARAIVPFSFLPIEPPRRRPSSAETYARRTFQFSQTTRAVGGRKGSDSIDSSAVQEIPQVRVDARLPNPPVLTCNEDVPLRVLVTRINKFSEHLFLQSLQIELSGYTHVRAHEIGRKESTSWLIMSMSNMGIPIGNASDVVGSEIPLNREYWDQRPLPNTVAPSFETCNLARTYEIEIRIGLSCGSAKDHRPQTVVLPLRIPVTVYSGIAPPQALLDAMQDSDHDNRPARVARKSAAGGEGTNTTSPSTASSLGQPVETQYEDAPPSYEDVIAQDLPPIDGPRRDYAPPPVPEGQSGFPEEKGG